MPFPSSIFQCTPRGAPVKGALTCLVVGGGLDSVPYLSGRIGLSEVPPSPWSGLPQPSACTPSGTDRHL